MRHPAYALALLLPAALLFGYRGWLRAAPELSEVARSMDRRLASSKPDVVILGSSVALRDVDRASLGEALGIPERKVLKLTVPAGTAAHWYAVLRHRVVDRGHRPRLILIADTLAALLTPDVEGHEVRLRLAGQLASPDPVLSELVFGGPGGLAGEHARLQQRRMRRALVGSVPDAVVGLATGGDGRQAVLQATDVVFRTDALDPDRHGGVPVMFREPEPERRWFIPERLDDTLLPHLLRTVDEIDAELVFARLPLSPSFPEADRLEPALERRAFAAIAEAGHTAVELRSLELDDTWFEDRDHLGTEGMLKVTAILADVAQQSHRGEFSTFVAPVPELMRGEESLPWSDGLTTDSAVSLTAHGELRVCGDGELRIDGVVHPFGRHRLDGEATVSVVGRIDGLSFGLPMKRVVALGYDNACAVDSVRLVGGRVSDLHATATFDEEAEVYDAKLQLTPVVPGVAKVNLVKWRGLADAPSDPDALGRLDEGALAGNDFMADACSPLRVFEDGVQLPYANAFCAHVRQLGDGRSCHVGASMLLSSSTGAQPAKTPARYRIGLEPTRRCALKARKGNTAVFDGLWVYPGDAVTLTAGRPLRREARRLSVRATPMRGPGESLRVSVGSHSLEAAPALREQGLAELVWDEGLDTDEVRIVNDDETFWLLTLVALADGEAPTRWMKGESEHDGL